MFKQKGGIVTGILFICVIVAAVFLFGCTSKPEAPPTTDATNPQARAWWVKEESTITDDSTVLEVYHDVKRGATCWVYNYVHISCLSDDRVGYTGKVWDNGR